MDANEKTKLSVLQRKLKGEIKRVERQTKAFESRLKELQAELRGIEKVEAILTEEKASCSNDQDLDDLAIAALGELKFTDQVKQIVLSEGKGKELTHKIIADRIQELFPEKTRKHLRQAVINTMSRLKKQKPEWLAFERRNNIMRYWVAENYSSIVDVDEGKEDGH